MFLKKVTLKREEVKDPREYPFHIPAIKSFSQMDFNRKVTFFVGENGSGKSTLLEAIADQCGFNPAGGGRNNTYNLHASESALGPYLRLSWMPKVTNGFFLRAESFYQFATHLDELDQDDLEGLTYQSYGGKSLHEQSHGESFLSLFANRFQQKAIYLLDEPEAALSPQRQLALLKIMHDLEKQGNCQFIIATHSPILLGYPDADILSFDEGKIQSVAYEMTDHYQITSYFLQHRERMLEQLFAEEDEE
ncbi:ATPase AAA [Jeotgalibacillus alimentarius]|uniref:ATPase AAA n=1 Tax=Jeotgalibacillus alimentarius TaxID=135826 RepID=A0A0C2W4L2_9BACL|nr:AAA family ATPase [Jeotgalibacillus alimentarius]KIL51516.1 ATPase AAA [Jeotgalibacillus alimentarius]